MLSRVAEKLYWAARYIERIENTARLIRSYNLLIFDIPYGSEPSWMILVEILDGAEQFKKFYSDTAEQNVHKFLISRKRGKNSLYFSINQARENIRATRDVLPEDAWELINEIFLYISLQAKRTSSRRSRLIFLEKVIHQTQTLSGLLETTVYRDHTYGFMKLGFMTERADMTTRVLQVGARDIIEREGIFSSIDPILWAALLETLSAKNSFRRLIGPIIEKDPVIDFIIKEQSFPRSIFYCLNEARNLLAQLPNNLETIFLLDKVKRKIKRFKSNNSDQKAIDRFVSSLQSSLTQLDLLIYEQWFQGGKH